MPKDSKTTKKAPMVKKALPKVKKKITRTVPSGIAHVKATFNNTIISISDPSGNVIAWSSAGKVNFSGSRKSSAFAAKIAAQDAAKSAMSYGLKELEVYLKGPGAGREPSVTGFQVAGLIVTVICDRTPVQHGGPRPRKRRRV